MTISVPTSLVGYLTLAIDNTKWTANKTYADGENTVFSYVYNTVLTPGEQTKELLSSITVKESAGKEFVTALQNLEDTDEVTNDFSVVVIGYAIQEKGLEGVNSTVALNKGFETVFDKIA